MCIPHELLFTLLHPSIFLTLYFAIAVFSFCSVDSISILLLFFVQCAFHLLLQINLLNKTFSAPTPAAPPICYLDLSLPYGWFFCTWV